MTAGSWNSVSGKPIITENDPRYRLPSDEYLKPFKKDDEGKLRWAKFAWTGAAQVMDIMHFGADKYGWDNWRKAANSGENQERYLSAAIRHLRAHMEGELVDPESSRLHIAHAACCLLFWLDNHERENVP
jgi:hypothetical protein